MTGSIQIRKDLQGASVAFIFILIAPRSYGKLNL